MAMRACPSALVRTFSVQNLPFLSGVGHLHASDTIGDAPSAVVSMAIGPPIRVRTNPGPAKHTQSSTSMDSPSTISTRTA